jgi:fatty-acyl-CoA synthase
MPQIENASNPLDLGVVKDFPTLKNIVLFGDKEVRGMINFKDLLTIYTSGDEAELIRREKHINFEAGTNIQFTSGTTGYPKGALLTHHNILNNALYVGEVMKITPNDRIVIPLPLYHCFGMVLGNLIAINYGAAMVYPAEVFDPAHTLEAITKYKGTAVYGVPTMFIAMLETLAKNKDKYDVSSLRTGLISGAVVPEPLMKRIYSDMGMQ